MTEEEKTLEEQMFLLTFKERTEHEEEFVEVRDDCGSTIFETGLEFFKQS